VQYLFDEIQSVVSVGSGLLILRLPKNKLRNGIAVQRYNRVVSKLLCSGSALIFVQLV
jgi:hypothetical protein